jgi:hypothetical protein
MDPKIESLVQALQQAGIQTCGSCQGRGLPKPSMPYVAFYAPLDVTARLERWLREDAKAEFPILAWGWFIEAGFDEQYRLVYRLTTAHPHRALYRWGRYWLDMDIRALASHLQRELQRSLPMMAQCPT